MSVVTVLPEACKHIKTNTTPTRSLKSMESIYSITPSSKFSALSRRKINQKNTRDRNPTLVPAVSEIKQRVMSARMLRIKQLQNQIGEAHHRIAELTAENRLLTSLHKRQDSALSKYENSNAELPQLLHSHSEELRVWQTRCRNLQRHNKELQVKLKQKETILMTISDQNKQLVQLNKDKNLQERATLQERNRILEDRCMDKENEIKLLARRLQLESKSFKSNLNMEQQKYRDLLMKIEMSDFLMLQDNKKLKTKSLYNKSPLNRITSKSAVNVSHINGDKEFSAGVGSPTTILPPFSNNNSATMKKVETFASISNNNNNNNNSVRKDDGANDDDYNSNEIDLTKNCIDKSDEHGTTIITTGNDENDEATKRIKNGMSRVRQQPNKVGAATAKLSPLHTEQPAKPTATTAVDNSSKSDKKSISNDSELSDDDDEDFTFFSNHNGTKTTQINARDLLDHKMHITELEEKMKQNSLDENTVISNNSNNNNKPKTRNVHQCSSFMPKTSNSSSISSSNDDIITLRHDEFSFDHQFNDRGDNDLISIQRELRDSHLNRESILDEYCATIYDDDKTSHYSESTVTRIKRLEFARGAANTNSGSFSKNQPSHQGNDHAKSNGHATAAAAAAGRKEINGRAARLDEKKKKGLLAILKNIDGNGSVEN